MPEPSNELVWRIGVFVAIFAVMALLERWLPRRKLDHARLGRWRTNLMIVAIDTLFVRLLAGLPAMLGWLGVPLVAVAAAVLADRWQLGLLHALSWPGWLEIIAALLLLDFAIWLQHLASHKIPVLWRLHRVHHADPDFDVTTALRFHPIEIALSMLYKVAWVLLLGAPVAAVIVFEIVLSGCAMFNHANVRLPLWLDRRLRLVIVTPDMHRVHHSTDRAEHDMNYGFNLSLWDRLFATYKAQPDAGHEAMAIGLPAYRQGEPTRLGWSLLLPFRRS